LKIENYDLSQNSMIYLKKNKQLGAVCFLLGTTIFLSGCLDSGLKLMAKKHESETKLSIESIVELDREPNKESDIKSNEEAIAGNENPDVDELLEDQTAEQIIKLFFKELGDFIKNIDQLATDEEKIADQENGSENESNAGNKEEDGNLDQELQEQSEQPKQQVQSGQVESINSNEENLILCDQLDSNNCQANSVVCAQVKTQTENSEEVEWLEFENACKACQNSFQKIGNMTLEIVGFKEGKCSLP